MSLRHLSRKGGRDSSGTLTLEESEEKREDIAPTPASLCKNQGDSSCSTDKEKGNNIADDYSTQQSSKKLVDEKFISNLVDRIINAREVARDSPKTNHEDDIHIEVNPDTGLFYFDKYFVHKGEIEERALLELDPE